MKLVVFGLSVSSAWGNGHATLWRGILRALAARGHAVTFFERDTPYYALHRDLPCGEGYEIVAYPSWGEVERRAAAEVASCDVALVTSYQADAQAASELVLASRSVRVFYDLDTPVTLAMVARGEPVPYLPSSGLGGFDLVLSYTGGEALARLRALGAKRAAPLYGSVDPASHHPAAPSAAYACDLSYLATYAPDRQATVYDLFLRAAERRPSSRFLAGGPMYPTGTFARPNVRWIEHVPPPDHPAFYASSRATLSVTRGAMAELGWCPSGRLFEAAACGAAIVSDRFAGLDAFFEPGREILVAETTDDVLGALALPDSELRSIGLRARERALAEHTAARRADELIELARAATPTMKTSHFRVSM